MNNNDDDGAYDINDDEYTVDDHDKIMIVVLWYVDILDSAASIYRFIYDCVWMIYMCYRTWC